MYDIHCHVLYGVDDGAKDINDSMLICRIANKEGVKTIAATPHYIDGESVVDAGVVMSQVDILNKELMNINLDLNILPGMEVYIVPDLAEFYENGKIITLNNGCYMLIELPLYETLPSYVEQTLFELQVKGIKPVIAHPERCKAIMKHPNIVYRLIEKGCYMQMNAGSLLGHFGREVQKTANTLLGHKMAHVISSDTHSGTGRMSSLKECYSLVKQKMGKEAANDLFKNNSEKIVNSLELDIEEPRMVEHRKFLFFKF